MPTITNTHLTVESGSQPTKAKVTVKSEVNFGQTDSGAWKMGLKLFGDDTAEAGGTPLVYTFRFGPGNVPLLKRDYLTVQGTLGTLKINESREIDWEVLDEDPGQKTLANAPPVRRAPLSRMRSSQW